MSSVNDTVYTRRSCRIFARESAAESVEPPELDDASATSLAKDIPPSTVTPAKSRLKKSKKSKRKRSKSPSIASKKPATTTISTVDAGLREKVVQLEDEIAHDWRLKVRALTERVKKQDSKLDEIDALKMEKAALKKPMEKMDVVRMERKIHRLKERVKDMVGSDVEWRKSVKEYQNENSLLTVDITAAEVRIKVLVAKVEKLENSESRIEEERMKREHAVEMKRLQLEITRENGKKDANAEEIAEKRSTIAIEVKKVKTAELKARRKCADELVVKRAKKKESHKKARERQALENLNTTRMNAIAGRNGYSSGMVGTNYPINGGGGGIG